MRELVVSGLRSELDRRRTAPRADFHFPTFVGSGLSPDVEVTAMVERSYEPS